MQRKALVIGISGVTGRALSEHLLKQGWEVHGLSRGRTEVIAGCHSIRADLTDAEAVSSAITDLGVSHVFLNAWSRQATEQENCRVNGDIVRHVLQPLGRSGRLEHAALVTGLKHYLGPFEAYAAGEVPDTPFRESQGRQPGANFYYAQEDELFAAAREHGFSWSVHRPHTVIGYAPGNAMNMGQTLAVYASLCKAEGKPFIFPGSAAQWNGLTDMTDADQLASQLEWAGTHEAGRNQAFNIVNGDVFRWRWMWPALAEYFGIEAAPFDGRVRPLESRMQQAGDGWRQLAQKHDLKQPDIGQLATWWHTDADLGRPMEVLTDMSKSRKAGFLDYRCTLDSFVQLFERLRQEQLIPR
ncbi:SDR family oxidoreductase [Frateuria aurantia]|uniref:Nucleoside-diphosphate-sugar epimerase n=1 Tax=Frateuria aurantia (strain ATCC 33424 / DSM 6220 / KCTC 2777 / LMG 1558 / NBRC 3245 / NCIMB 13370) TaxID=767434 RepID=H8L422_FRAAD|nr:SDR family oxidoreductase [Frateuria aurantia]AFC85616.1 nucleoside-diphosphate-sugar epimerase [Frateuria aurantia DSM 6220]